MRRLRKEVRKVGFRSKFEMDIAEWLTKRGIKYEYEPCKIDYVVPESKHKYTPDWLLEGDKAIFYESKGRLTAADRKKLILFRLSNPHITIRLIFMNANVKITKNSKTSYADWSDKNGFEWCDWSKGIPKAWLNT